MSWGLAIRPRGHSTENSICKKQRRCAACRRHRNYDTVARDFAAKLVHCNTHTQQLQQRYVQSGPKLHTAKASSHNQVFTGVAEGGGAGRQKFFIGFFVGMRVKMGLNLVRCIPADEIKR